MTEKSKSELEKENAELRRQLAELKAIAAAENSGSGTIVQGTGVAAAGEDGIAVNGNVNGGIRQVQAGTYVEQQVVNPEENSQTSLRRAYLRQVIQQTGFLALDGIDPKSAGSSGGSRLNLSAVYTGLLTNTLSEQDEQEGQGVREKQDPLSALTMLDRHPRLVLLGDPGSGKSTFVNFVALCLAGEALDHPEANLALLTAPLPADKENEEKVEPQPWQHGPLLPVRVIFRDFAARGLPEDPEAEASCDHLARFLTAELKADLPDYPLMTELADCGGLVMFDGLDEVPEANRRRVQIKQVLESFLQTYPGCRVLVTSRTYAYLRQQWRIPTLVQAELAPFTDPQIRFFIEQWYAHIGERKALQREEQEGRAALLQQAVFASSRLRELAERPLLLGLMVSLHAWRGGSLPENREELYADTVALLLDLWESPKIVYNKEGQVVLQQLSLAVYLRTDRGRVRRLLEELAFAAHAGQPELTGTADIQEDELVLRLLRLDNGEVSPAALRDYLSQRAGLLTPRGVGVYTFYHRTFQEYLAACYLTDHDFPEQAAELGQEDPARWREALLLAGAKAGRGSRANIWQLSDELCPLPLTEATAALEQLHGALLAGQVLADCVDMADFVARDKDDQDKKLGKRNRIILARVQQGLKDILIGSRLAATDRVAAGNALARLGDPRFRPDRWFLPDEDLLGFIEIPAGEFLMGDDGDERASPQHTVRLERYFIGRYPVTVDQFRCFVTAAKHTPANSASLNGFANHPVKYVSWYDAVAYCKWLNQVLRESPDTPEILTGLLEKGWQVRLPSEAEWEKAARGDDGRVYPWGNEEADAERANYNKTGINSTSTVGCFPGGASPYGLQDCAGNLLEWTRSLWGEDWRKPKFIYPYDPADALREDENAGKDVARILRGWGYWASGADLSCARRLRARPRQLVPQQGFSFRSCPQPPLWPLILRSSGLWGERNNGGDGRGGRPAYWCPSSAWAS